MNYANYITLKVQKSNQDLPQSSGAVFLYLTRLEDFVVFLTSTVQTSKLYYVRVFNYSHSYTVNRIYFFQDVFLLFRTIRSIIVLF